MSETKTLSLDERIKAVENNLPTLFLKYPQHFDYLLQTKAIESTSEEPSFLFVPYVLKISRKTTGEVLFEMSNSISPSYESMILHLEDMLDDLFSKPFNSSDIGGWELYNNVCLRKAKQRYLQENANLDDNYFASLLLENGFAFIKTDCPLLVQQWLSKINIETVFFTSMTHWSNHKRAEINNIKGFPGDSMYVFKWVYDRWNL